MALDFIAVEFYGKLRKIIVNIWLYRALEQMYVISRGVILNFLLKFDCCEFSAVKINGTVDSTYRHYVD